jgi:hypothetical protein
MAAKRFTMDTRTFTSIWKNHTEKESANDWRKFVLAIFERFATGNQYKNMDTLTAHDKNWKKWDDDAKYKYLSEKAYSKCMAIRKSIKNHPDNKTGFEPALPNGYKQRNGGTGSSRPTGADLMNIFMGA